MSALISFLSSAVTFSFAAIVLRQYLKRGRPYQAVWAVALACFGVGVFVEFIANLTGWSVVAFRIWFLFGATFAAAILGLGTVHLLLPARVARAVTAAAAAIGVWAVYRVLTMPIHAAVVLPAHGQARPPSVNGIASDVTALVVVFNSLGTVAVVGGAVWSAWLYWRRRRALYRVASNLLIAGGALIVASSGSLAGLGDSEFLFIGELAGIVLIFAGFLRSEPKIGRPSLNLLHGLRLASRVDAPTSVAAAPWEEEGRRSRDR